MSMWMHGRILRNSFIFFASLVVSAKSFAQYKESEHTSLFNKLVWDDKMLNIMIDSRTDFQTVFNNDSLESADFRAQTFRLLLTGEILPGFRYRIRHRFNKVQSPLIRDNYSSATDQAWLAFDVGKKWTITVGKQTVLLGTFEFDYNGADTYLVTMVDGDFDLYKTGVATSFKALGQEFSLQVVNSDAPQFASDAYKRKAFAFNFLWAGSLFDGKLRTRYGYGLYQHSASKFYSWLTLGTQVNIDQFIIELDYYLGSRNIDYSSIVNDSSLGVRYVKDQSLALNIQRRFGKFLPMVKTTWNKRYDKEDDSTAYYSNGLQLAVEFYPFEKEVIKDLRFHLAYVYQTTDYKNRYSSLDDLTTHTLLGGVRWLFKIK